jgi:NADH-quinone oxidoreductase subunit E
MAGAAVAVTFTQPDSFAFTKENEKAAREHIAKYPVGRQASALMPLLMLAQKQNSNWLPVVAIELVANMLSMPYMRAYEVASFYSQYNLAPVGRHHIQCCTTTPCWLAGSDEVVKAAKETLGIGFGETTPDGLFTLMEVECLGACVNAPMVQVNSHDGSDEFYEDLDFARTRELLLNLKRGVKPKAGPQSGRTSSEPAGGLTSLKETVKPAAMATKPAKASVVAAETKPAAKNPAAKKPAAKKKAK